MLPEGPGAEETLARLERQQLDPGAAEVVVVAAWPEHERRPRRDREGPLAVRHLLVSAAGEAAAVNAALDATQARLVLLLAAGDVPVDERLLAAHIEAHASGAGAVVGDVLAPAAGRLVVECDSWVGLRPTGAPRAPVRHVSVSRDTLVAADGLDERLRSLEVAVLDLLDRLAAAGAPVIERRDLAVRARARTREEQLRHAAELGRSANLLDRLLLANGRAVRRLGPRYAGVTLRWARPLLRRPPRERLPLRAAFAAGHGAPALPGHPLERGSLTGTLAPAQREAVAVVVPFAGDATAAHRLAARLAAIERGPGDELILVDNSRDGAASAVAQEEVRVVRAAAEWSSYHARNSGARTASAPWLLFIDDDCEPGPGLLDAYFVPPPADRCGAVVGAIRSPPEPGNLVEAHAEAAEILLQSRGMTHPLMPYGVTANLLVRRAAWEALGGFHEGVRSCGDIDLCWRLQDAGWALEYRQRAAVVHRHRQTLRALLRQQLRYGAGTAWLSRHRDDPRARIPLDARRVKAVAMDLAAGRPAQAAVRTAEILTTVVARVGALAPNRPRTPSASRESPASAVVAIARWPAADGAPAPGADAVEADHRSFAGALARGAVPVAYADDDGALEAARALLWRFPSRAAIRALCERGLTAAAREAVVAQRMRTRGVESAEVRDRDAVVGRAARWLGLG